MRADVLEYEVVEGQSVHELKNLFKQMLCNFKVF